MDPIEIHPQAKELAVAWEANELATQRLTPGMARRSDDSGRKELKADDMVAMKAHRWLGRSFGPGEVVGKVPFTAFCRAYAFRGRTILSFSRALGTSWELALGEAREHGGGKTFGREELAPCDKEAVEFWPDFCEALVAQMRMDPLEAKAAREAAALDREAGSGGAPRRASL